MGPYGHNGSLSGERRARPRRAARIAQGVVEVAVAVGVVIALCECVRNEAALFDEGALAYTVEVLRSTARALFGAG